MTIAEFCLDHLRQNGPTALADLAALAAAEGVTRSRTPELSVRTALRDAAAELPGDRWASPLALLEGRCLTTRSLAWAARDYWSDDGPAPLDRRPVDLAPLLPSLVSGVPLATGGILRRNRYGDSWHHPDGWPFVDADPERLVCLRLQEGVLHASAIDLDVDVRTRGRELADQLGTLERTRGGYWPAQEWKPLVDTMLPKLWALLDEDATLLRQPAGPLSLAVPQLRDGLAKDERERLARWELQQREWQVHLTLPAELRGRAVDLADLEALPLDAWLADVLLERLRGRGAGRYGDVLQFPSSW